MLLRLQQLISCLFLFEVRPEVISAPSFVLNIIHIEPHQYLSDLIRIELAQKVVNHDHANFSSVFSY